jgi:hypothetical protein
VTGRAASGKSVRLVKGSDGQNKVLGPLPVLFGGVGPGAEKTLAEFAALARGLTTSIQGPFGLVLADALGELRAVCDWPWLADFKIPESVSNHESSEAGNHNHARLASSVPLLVRRLRLLEPTADPAAPGRIRLNSYVLLDLSAVGVVASGLEMMQVLRRTDPAHDMTVLGLTARTATTDSTHDSEWFEAWKQFLAQLQEEPLVQRVYLLDGCDADKTWLERPEQLHRLAAEFLLYHGFTCRGLLRQKERARAGPAESVLHVCGSFGRRMVQMDSAVVIQRVAERLAREELSDLYRREASPRWLESVTEQAQALADRIGGICERAYQARSALAGGRRDRIGGHLAASAEMSQVVAQAIRDVCSREPLVSLCHFFKHLRPRLGGLLTRQQLWRRARTRRLVMESFQRQEDSTYAPLRAWLANPQTQWADRFTPRQTDPVPAAVSQPASWKAFLGGGLLLVLGLTAVAAGLWWEERAFVIGGGLLAIAASAVMTLPRGWARYRRRRVGEGEDAVKFVASVLYRRSASPTVLGIAGALLAAGLAGVLWPLWPVAWVLATLIWVGVVAVAAGTGVALMVWCPTELHPDRASDKEAPGQANPPILRWRAAGLLCFAVAWVALWLPSPAPTTVDMMVQWLIQVAGLLLIAGGTALALFPRAGRTYLVDRVPKLPQPFTGGLGYQTQENELSRRVAAMGEWLEQLVLDPEQYERWAQAADSRRDRETLFDFLAADWESQFAEAVRHELKTRSDKTLKALALQPALWTECVARELLDPHTPGADLTTLFALQAVKAWFESHTLAELLSLLRVDMERFRRLTGRLASPHWPAPRIEPETSASVVVIGKPVWDILAPLMQPGAGPQVVPLDWDSNACVILALRIVQGLTQGWRGFPGLPGQLHEHDPAVPLAPDPGPGSESPSPPALGG